MLIEKNELKELNQNERSEVINLMTRSMREDKNRENTKYKVDQEYPTVFSVKNKDNLWALKEGGIIVSTLGAYPYNIALEDTALKTIAIGSVSTHPDHRKKGHSSFLHKSALSHYKKLNFDIAILWTDLFDLYRKYDYELSGEEIIYVIDNPLKNIDKSITVKPFSKEDSLKLYKLYSEKKNSVERTFEEFSLLLSIPDMDILCAYKNNVLMAYTIRGKGSDLKKTIHEWGGETDSVLSLINANLENEKSSIYLISNYCKHLDEKLNLENIIKHRGNLGMIKILSPEKFFFKIFQDEPDLKLSKTTNNKFTISNRKEQISLDISLLTKLFFGPLKPIELFNSKFPELSKELSLRLPLHFFVWGLDSV